MLLLYFQLALASCIRSSTSPVNLHHCLPGSITTKSAVIGRWIKCNYKLGWKTFLLDDSGNFRMKKKNLVRFSCSMQENLCQLAALCLSNKILHKRLPVNSAKCWDEEMVHRHKNLHTNKHVGLFFFNFYKLVTNTGLIPIMCLCW